MPHLCISKTWKRRWNVVISHRECVPMTAAAALGSGRSRQLNALHDVRVRALIEALVPNASFHTGSANCACSLPFAALGAGPTCEDPAPRPKIRPVGDVSLSVMLCHLKQRGAVWPQRSAATLSLSSSSMGTHKQDVRITCSREFTAQLTGPPLEIVRCHSHACAQG